MVGCRQYFVLSGPQAGRQKHRAESHSLEPGNLRTNGFPQPPYFPLAPFHDDHREPAVAAGRLTGDDITEAGRSIVQIDAIQKLFDLLLADRAANATQVFAVDPAGRVHHAIGQFAVGGQQQQTGSIDIEAANRNPAALCRPRQTVEHGCSSLRIASCRDLAFRLVVNEGLVLGGSGSDLPAASVQADSLAGADTGSRACHLAINPNLATLDARLDGPPRSEAGSSQNFCRRSSAA